MTLQPGSGGGVAGASSGIGRATARTIALLGAMVLANHLVARRTERRYPPRGSFVAVNGIRLHYLDTGSGRTTIVLLHGNGAMIEDFAISGVIDRLARKYRVIAFDRPGFGHSARPRGTVWSAAAQAALLRRALQQLGVDQPLLVGHSWGALVALAMALDPRCNAAALTLLSGYYTPTARLDVLLGSITAIPLLGDVLRYTVLPALARLLMPTLLRRIFAPHPVSDRFWSAFPVAMAVRPRHLRASAADTALMDSSAATLLRHAGGLSIPVILAAGTEDRMVETELHSARLHRIIRGSELRTLKGAGHMLHHTEPEQVVAAIEAAVSAAGLDDQDGSAGRL